MFQTGAVADDKTSSSHVPVHQDVREKGDFHLAKAVVPGMKARNLTKDQVIQDVLLQAQPTKEFVTSEQVAALALFLCGDDAAQITGANLSIDGGWTAA